MIMPDGTTSLLMQTWDWLSRIVIFVIGLLFINQRKLQKDLDEVRYSSVDSNHFEKAVDRLREDMHHMHDETRQDIKDIANKIK